MGALKLFSMILVSTKRHIYGKKGCSFSMVFVLQQLNLEEKNIYNGGGGMKDGGRGYERWVRGV